MKTTESTQKVRRLRKSVPPMPMEGLMRLDQVLRYYPVGKTTLYKEINEGRFPQQVKIGCSVFWDAVQLRAFLKKVGATVSMPESTEWISEYLPRDPLTKQLNVNNSSPFESVQDRLFKTVRVSS